MIATRFTELVGCAVPIQQAGMGAAAPPELAAAVSQAGALGMLGTARAGLTAATLADLLERTRLLTDKPFGVNFIVAPVFLNGTAMRPPLDMECIKIAARAAKVVEFFYGDPERRFVEMAHAGGALACWQVGSREEGGRGRPGGMRLRRRAGHRSRRACAWDDSYDDIAPRGDLGGRRAGAGGGWHRHWASDGGGARGWSGRCARRDQVRRRGGGGRASRVRRCLDWRGGT